MYFQVQFAELFMEVHYEIQTRPNRTPPYRGKAFLPYST